MIGTIPGTDVHWGLVFGIVACLRLYPDRSHGLRLRRADRRRKCPRRADRGLIVGTLIMTDLLPRPAPRRDSPAWSRSRPCRAAPTPIARRRLRLHRHPGRLHRPANPLAIIPVAILLGGISASGGLLQRRLDLPDATVLVLQGISSSSSSPAMTLYGRFGFLKGRS